jgi:hypothetical protein
LGTASAAAICVVEDGGHDGMAVPLWFTTVTNDNDGASRHVAPVYNGGCLIDDMDFEV